MLTARPTTSPAPSMVPARTRMRSADSRPRDIATSGVIGRSPEARHEGAHHEVPSVGEHEEEELEGQRDHHGREHEHAHGGEDARDHHVDDEERDEEHEADLEG